MPFAGYDDFDDCVSSNQDKRDPEAYCGAIKREVEGESAMTDVEIEHAQRLDAEREASDTATLAQFRNPGDIQRVERDGDVVYKRVMLLSPGTWTDAGSETTVDYSAEGIRASAENFVDMEDVQAAIPEWPRLSNQGRAEALADADGDIYAESIPLNFLHGPSMHGAESLDEIGEIPTDSIIVDDDGRLYGDLVLHGDSAESETAINLMDDVLEAVDDPERRTPPVGPSVEIPADRVAEQRGGPLELKEAWFSAVGIVFNPASRPVELGTQAQQRAVAMASPSEDDGPVGPRALQGEAAVHEPDFTGTLTGAPEAFPGMDDFDTNSLDSISDHAVASLSGFPPEDFDDLLGFVVTTDGDLSLPLLREVASSLAAAELGDESTFMARLPKRQQAEAWQRVAKLAARNFGDAVSPTLRQAVEGASTEDVADLSRANRALQAEDWSDIDTGDYPEAAVENARMALEARDETGNPNDCGTDIGWARANQLDNGETLSPETVQRMANFRRHQDNAEMDDDEGRADCGWMMWKAWGGEEGVSWAEDKVDQAEAAARENTALRKAARLNARTRTLLSRARHGSGSMDSELEDALRTLEQQTGELARELQDMAMVMNLVEDAEGEGFDTSEQTVAELVEFVQTEMDVDEDGLQELQNAADAYLQTIDADSLDATSAEGMLEWLDEAGAADEEEGNPGDGEEEEMEETASMEELEQVKETIGTVAEHMGDIKDMLQAQNEQVETLERRLSDLEDEPDQRSLSGEQSTAFIESDDADEDRSPTGPPTI